MKTQAEKTIAATEPFDFVTLLAGRSERLRKRSKRIRTRARILAAVASEIAEKGYDGLTVDGVCEIAGIARGTFYLYYRHRAAAAVAAYRTFWLLMHRSRPRVRGDLSERIRVTNLHYLTIYARNASFLSGQAALAREQPDYALALDSMNHRWSLLIASNMAGNIPQDIKILRSRALVAMADELLNNIFTRKTPTLRHWAEDPVRLAECLSDLWGSVAIGPQPPGIKELV